MARFKKKGGKGLPEINTGSMSDIIFMFLFFFMVITTIREATLIVRVRPPQATEVQKLEKKSLVSNIYIGAPMKKDLGAQSRIQLNDQFGTIDDIQEFITRERDARDEADRPLITTSLKIDKDTRMGIVTDVKQELRRIGAFKINYSAAKGKVQKK
jgi:biopolymer transport protein ExbD